METPQPDKTGMHILLKLASLVVILAGIHAAADIIVQLLLALFFAIVLNPLVTGANAAADGLGKSGYLHHGANDRAFRGNGERAFAGDDRSFHAV